MFNICPLTLDQKLRSNKYVVMLLLLFRKIKGYLNEMRRVSETGNRIPLNSNVLSCLHTIYQMIPSTMRNPFFSSSLDGLYSNSHSIRVMSHGNKQLSADRKLIVYANFVVNRGDLVLLHFKLAWIRQSVSLDAFCVYFFLPYSS